MIVIGGGDTGADCIGTSLRHGAKSIVNFELMSQPPADRAANNPWPQWPRVYRLDYSHEEVQSRTGQDPRQYDVLTKEFVGVDGRVTGVKTVRLDWTRPTPNGPPWTELEGSETVWPADLVFLATGFVGPELAVGEMLGLETDEPRRGWTTFRAEHGNFATNVAGRLRRRRLPPRPEPGRLGHQRRPRRGSGDRRVPDGRVAALRAGKKPAAASGLIPLS